jgi:hypothetical protein
MGGFGALLFVVRDRDGKDVIKPDFAAQAVVLVRFSNSPDGRNYCVRYIRINAARQRAEYVYQRGELGQ